MTDDRSEDDNDADSEWTAETKAWALTGRRTNTGELFGISCKASWSETRDDDSDDSNIRNRVAVHLNYHVEDGVASLDMAEDDDEMETTAFDLRMLKAIPAADRLVESVPDVERVKTIDETVAELIDNGRTALDDGRQH